MIACEETCAEVSRVEEMALAMERRAQAYGFVARLYRVEVDSVLLEQLKNAPFPRETGNANLDGGYREMAEYLSDLPSDPLVELAVDYVRCFIGHGQDTHCAAYPYESVYTSERRLMMQEARDEVLALYRSEGLDKTVAWRMGEDHISLELEFMMTLADRTASALRAGDQLEALRLLGVQRGFLDEHVGRWSKLMTRDLRAFAKTGLYRGLALVTDGFIELDRQLLDDICGQL